MNDQLRIIKLEEQVNQLQQSIVPQMRDMNTLEQKISKLDVFITNNPRVDLISDTIQLLNSQLKIQERLSSIESQHSKFSSHYDDILNRHSVYIMQIQPWIDQMRGILEEAKANSELSNQMKISFKEMNHKYKEFTALLLQNDRLTQHYRTRLDQFETQLMSKIDHSEITKVQDLMRRDFVTCLELNDIKSQLNQKVERMQSEMCTKQQLNSVQDQLQFIKERQVSVLSELVDKKVEELANNKLRIYATKNDQRVFEDRVNQVCKILSEKILMMQRESTEGQKSMQEQLKEENQMLNDFKTQIQLINSTFQKVVMKDELQVAMQKTLRLQRESEYLNEKLESISAEIFEQKATFQAFNKQKNVEIQNLHHQLVSKEGESITYNESPRRVEMTQEEFESAQSSPTRKRMRKSNLIRQGSAVLTSDVMQRIFQRSDTRIQELQDQIEEIRKRLPNNSKLSESLAISQVPVDSINIRMEYFNQMITQLLEEVKKVKFQIELINQQIMELNNKPQIKEEMIAQLTEKLQFVSDLEFKLEQKCDSSLVIPILDSKANAQDYAETRILSRQLKQCIFDTIGSLRAFFTSDQNDQIRDLLINQLGRYLTYFAKYTEVISDCQNTNSSVKQINNHRGKSYSSCSKRRETDHEIRGRAVNRNITETAMYNSLRTSPLAYRLVNQNKKSAAIVKRMKIQ